MLTDDIYCAAYLAIAGLKITDISVSPNGKGEKVIFSLAGENEQRITQKFESGTAVVNIKDYLYKLFEIRNVMYSMKNSLTAKSKFSGQAGKTNALRHFDSAQCSGQGGLNYEKNRHSKD